MVAIVHQSNSIRNAIHYNEHKVRQKVAELIHAGNYPKDVELLSFSERMNRLQRQAELNIRTEVNCLHISLNFDEADKPKLNNEKLREIADTYMEKIGFGEQPYLVYRHHDAGHEHVHIVTTNIKNDGKRIALHNLARNQSMTAAKEIEKEFNLAVATDKQRLAYQLKPINTVKAEYGRFETRRAITNVLDQVLPKYKYTSVAELNAVLKLYNVVADTGSRDSRIARNGGLVYHILNNKGEKLGVPIKASLIYNKPTLTFLQEKFSQNEALRQHHKMHLKNAVDYSIKTAPGPLNLDRLESRLREEGVQLVIRQNKEGRIYGITYVDHKSKCVFNGSDLGKPYAAAGLLQRLDRDDQKITQKQKIVAADQEKRSAQKQARKIPSTDKEIPQKDISFTANQSSQKALDILTKEEYDGTLSVELQNQIRKRKRKRLRPE
jgi:hypothetical protein